LNFILAGGDGEETNGQKKNNQKKKRSKGRNRQQLEAK
jgi:hypothetical protein